MSQVSTQVQIKALANELWKVLINLGSLSQWLPDEVNLEPASQNSESKYYDEDPFQEVEGRTTRWEEGHRYAYEVKT